MCKFAHEKLANLLEISYVTTSSVWFKQTHRARAERKEGREGGGEGWTLLTQTTSFQWTKFTLGTKTRTVSTDT